MKRSYTYNEQFHEHYETRGETVYRVTVMLFDHGTHWQCESYIANRDTNSVSSIFTTRLYAIGFGKTARQAYYNADRHLRKSNSTIKWVHRVTYL
jgi:hypothetical protein